MSAEERPLVDLLSRKKKTDEPPNPAPGGESPVKVRRRPIILIAGILAVVLSVLGAVTLVSTLRETQSVYVAAADIEQGETLTEENLSTRHINADVDLPVITDPSEVVGMQAASRLAAGTVLNPDAVSHQVLPPSGQSIVGVSVPFNQHPTTPLTQGDFVRVVDTPRDQSDPPTQSPVATRGQVVAVHEYPEHGVTVVDLLVPSGEANWVAARSATNRVALVMDPAAGTEESVEGVEDTGDDSVDEGDDEAGE